jgi:hypothetical protein
MPGVRIALAAGVTLTALALALVLSRSPLAVAGTNGVPDELGIGAIRESQTSCQSGGTLPKGTTAVRVSLSANIGPQVELEALAGSRVVTEGERDAGWGVDETVTVPVRRVAAAVRDARVCVTTGPVVEPIQVNGLRVGTPDGPALLLRLEYLRPTSSSWLSLSSSVARRMGLAHAPAGTWVAYATALAMLATCAVASRLLLRELR